MNFHRWVIPGHLLPGPAGRCGSIQADAQPGEPALSILLVVSLRATRSRTNGQLTPFLPLRYSCKLLCVVKVDSEVIAIGGIKQKTASDFTKAGMPDLSNEFDWELGYLFTDSEYTERGIASNVARLLIETYGQGNLMASTEIAANPLGKLALISTGSPSDFESLEKLTGIDQARLATLSYIPVANGGKVNDYRIFANPVPRYTIRLRRPKICPRCLAETPYARKIWELAAVTACPMHKTLLLDECPSCKKKITWRRAAVTSCKCNFDWRRYRAPVVQDNEIQVAKHIYQVCNLVDNNETSKGTLPARPFSDLTLDQYLSCLFFIAGQFKGLMDTRGKRLATSHRNSEIHSVICKAHTVFQDWPNNFFTFLDWKRENSPDLRYARGLRRDFGQYKSGLYVQLSGGCYDFLRTAFEEYIAVHWQGGYPTALTRLNDKAGQSKGFLTVVETKHMLGVTAGSVHNLVAAGRLQAADETDSPKPLLLIKAESARQFQQKLEGSLSLHQTERRLGVYAQRVMELIQSGFLNPLRGPTVDRCHNWRFSNEEVTQFLDRLENAAARLGSFRKGVTLDFALRRLRPVGAHCGALAQAVLDGEISLRAKKGKAGLSRFLYASEHITSYVRRKLRLLAGEVYSIRDAASFLKSNPLAVYFFANTGILKTERRPGLEALGRSTTKKYLDQFLADYFILTRAGARALGTDTDYIVRLLAQKNVRPVSGRTIDGGVQYLFNVSDVAKINLQHLVANAWQEQFHKRPKPRGMDLGEISAILGVDRNSALLLVANGFLKPSIVGQNTKKDGQYYIPYSVVEECKKKSIKYRSLLSIEVAARLIGIGQGALRNAVRSGRLSAISAKRNEHGLYMKREDVEKQITANQIQVGTREAAKILGVSRGVLHEYNKKGIIKRISAANGFGRKRYLRRDVERVRDLRTNKTW